MGNNGAGDDKVYHKKYVLYNIFHMCFINDSSLMVLKILGKAIYVASSEENLDIIWIYYHTKMSGQFDIVHES